MEIDSDSKSPKNKKSHSFFSRLFIPMLVLAVLQFGTFFASLYISGEFSYMKRYAYDTFVEKTQNRKNYIENLLNQKTALVNETATKINKNIETILENENLKINDIKSNKELNKKILSSSSESLIELLRQNTVNDVFMVLETGELYYDNNESKACIYFRDIDISENAITDNQDLLMEAGSSEIANELGMSLDYEWSVHINMARCSNNDFYFNTINNAKENPDLPLYSLGYWSEMSKISGSALPSMKYTLPLISSDGEVYGVIGIGLMEKLILKNMPSYDFLSDSACYVLGVDSQHNDDYSTVIHSGIIYSNLINENTVIGHQNEISRDIYKFNSDLGKNTIGSIQEINIYNSDSPYKTQKWALISVGDEDKILNFYMRFVKLLTLSTGISIVISIIFTIIINKNITTPVTKIIKKLSSSKNANEIIRFKSSGIVEIDHLASSITELQINVREQASRVSKIISIMDIGIGVFMYDCTDENVFIGESLIKFLELKELQPMDMFISFDEFKKYISIVDKEGIVCQSTIFDKNDSRKSDALSIEINHKDENSTINKWYKFTLTKENSNVIGFVQDITNTVIEKKKIEYERDYDLTTGLLNRRAYYATIAEMFKQPEKLKVSAFIMWDLDNLKYVNDTYGHDFGDDYIKTAANVFKLFRDYGGIVARMSGDEFNVFLSGFESKDELRKIIKKIYKELSSSYCILSDGTHYKIRASGGISWYPDDSTSYELLIKYADFAMYIIKHSTKGSIAEFDESLYKKDSILITGVEEMNRIIDEECIKYAFHSIISAKTGEIYGYEALMRPQSELLKSPLELIRIAKTGAKLYEIERLTWFLSMRGFRRQVAEGNISDNAKIFINSLSNCIINNDDLENLEKENKEILGRVVMEILESEKVNDDYIKSKQEIISKWNGKIALDDFGSGYNSEYALINHSPNIIKIDRSIISGCDKDLSRISIINNLIQIAKSKNILVLAEGVETFNEMKTVINCGVDLLQGYYIDRPLFEPKPIDTKIIDEIQSLNLQ